ncbi:4-hydroxy-tetrahydrodipicolinate synthase [Methanomassiliicoccaceae archaeon COG_1]|nr:4-hydroxy-tetrahydrodipicolinate synthase [Methanomassiliicoccaceae archaeon COG_1]
MFRGTGTALITPFRRDGSVDEDALRRLVDFQEENGIDMLIACGSSGEAATLSREEHLRVIGIVIDQAKRAKVIAGAGSNSTREAVDLTMEASDMGADAVLSISPYYNKPTQEGIYLHYKAIEEASSVPVIIYNVPSRTGSNVLPGTVLRLAELPNIGGIKEASGDIGQIQEIISKRPEGFSVLSGDDSMTFDIMCSGGDGVISVASNCCPALMSGMVNDLLEGRHGSAREADEKLRPLFKGLFIESNPIPIKHVMWKMGYGVKCPRLPLTPLSTEAEARLEPILARYGLRGRAKMEENMLTVMKFGGTSVGSLEALERVANIISNTEGNKIVVVSAMSGITNFLVGLCEDIDGRKEASLKEFESKHLAVAQKLLDGELYDRFKAEFDERFDAFRIHLDDVEARGDPYYQDSVTSQGERFSSLLLSYKLRSMGIKSAALTSEEVGIVAEGAPKNGSADLKNTGRGMGVKLRPYIREDCVPVLTGFYGVMDDGRPLTFGRGGSDYSAAVVANAMDADALEIWTDVDGFMSADPRIVPKAERIDEMSYAEAAELAYFGAKVLHPRTIEPVRRKHIPLKVRNSFKPEEPGTLISQFRKPTEALLKSVAAKTDLSIISISSAEIAYHPETVTEILGKISQNGDALYSLSTSLSSFAILIHNNDVKDTLKKLNEIENEDIERIDVTPDVALVCCVGDTLLTKKGVSGDIFGVVKEANANVQMISEGASEVSLNFVVPMADVVQTIACLHKTFVEEAP